MSKRTHNTDIPSSKKLKKSASGRMDSDLISGYNPSLTSLLSPSSLPPSPSGDDRDDQTGRALWEQDLDRCKRNLSDGGDIEGYAGLMGRVEAEDMGDSTTFKLVYEHIEGEAYTLTMSIVFSDLDTYPAQYTTLLLPKKAIPKRAEKTLSRFTKIHHMDLPTLLARILSSFQGDDEANGKNPPQAREGDDSEGDNSEQEEEEEDMPEFESQNGPEMAVFDVSTTKEPDWSDLKLHFEQAKQMGYRPGLTKISDFWIISFSIPLKNIGIDPNTLGIWDDGLVDAWKEDQRVVMLIKTYTYPVHLDHIESFLGLHKNYKPSRAEMIATIRGDDGAISTFYLASALLGFLKNFPRAHKVRQAFHVHWDTADAIAFDEEKSRDVFHNNKHIQMESTRTHRTEEVMDENFERNIPLLIFWWTIRRFKEACRFCLNCGLDVTIPSLRPYVCDKPLCLYSFMSLGLGPSVEYVIKHHATVVDLLLSFAHTAANSSARMDLPLQLHIEVPKAFGLKEPTLLDDLPADRKRKALVWLIERLPKVSSIKESLENGRKLHQLGVPSGSIGVLRWVVGSCRAYLKEVKQGEGVLAQGSDLSMAGLRQFSFVVGSPAQEANFKEEVEKARLNDKNVIDYPSLLAFHGSGADRWHNILRNGLDYAEVTNARTSIYYCERSKMSSRENADFIATSAIALVELVNVPNTFVSRSPYYVVSQTKQIKPFLLLVAGDTPQSAEVAEGDLFQYDPNLKMKTSFNSVPLRVKIPPKLVPTIFVDDEADDSEDEKILNPKKKFEPSPRSRYDKLQLMQPPTTNSVAATTALGKAFKEVLKAQQGGQLPFYVDPDTESLYSWTIEMYEFAESDFLSQMERLGIPSVIAELRFPSTFPFSPPFMRILHPRFLPFSQGGGENITAGGSVCNEILTSTGWNIAYTIEAMVRDIMTNMTESIRPARLDPRDWDRPYGLHEAMEAYKRVARDHGWEVPKDFDKMMR